MTSEQVWPRPADLGTASFQPKGIFPRCWDTPSTSTPIPRLSHTAWFIFRKLDLTSKRRKDEWGVGATHTHAAETRPLKQKTLEIINPRSGRNLPKNRFFPPLNNQLTIQNKQTKNPPAAFHLAQLFTSRKKWPRFWGSLRGKGGWFNI